MNNKKMINKTKGLSVIELMIAMTVGIVIMAGMTDLYINNKGTFGYQEAQTKLQHKGNFLLYHINKVIRNAGYRSPPPTTDRIIFTPIDIAFPVGANYVSAQTGVGLNGSDSLSVLYQGSGDGAGTPDGLVRDCLDVNIDAFSSAISTFSVDNTLSLNCRAQNNTAGTDTTLSLMNQVELLKVQFGEDTTGDEIADRYVPANYVGLDEQNVRSVRISFLLRSEDEVMHQANTNTFNVLGTNFNPADDKRLRAVFTTTIQLRNVNPSE